MSRKSRDGEKFKILKLFQRFDKYSKILEEHTMKKVLFYFSHIIKLIISVFINFFYHVAIDVSKEKKTQIRDAIEELNVCTSREEMKEWYHANYTEYTKDGLIDWYPSKYTMLARQTDDCDGMAVLGQEVLKRYSELRYPNDECEIASYSFRSRKGKGGHAMAVMYDAYMDVYILFDYGNITEYDSMLDIKRYYNKTYKNIDNSEVDVYKMFNVPGPLFFKV